jgi:hypothetical protein
LMYFVQFWVFNRLTYRDKKVVSVFVAFSCAMNGGANGGISRGGEG